jgi:hypothetical protein
VFSTRMVPSGNGRPEETRIPDLPGPPGRSNVAMRNGRHEETRTPDLYRVKVAL